jgi:outer membrane protein assembly factor BamE (lipoprotein component of BamABCDE complex)
MFHKLTIACIAALLMSGCAATQTGQEPVSQTQVDSIQKGVTTRAQIDAMLGPPISIAIVDNGDRVASYHTRQATLPAVNVSVGPLLGPLLADSAASVRVRRQTLQVRYSASGVVQDYEFLDTTTVYNPDGTVERGNTNATPVSQPGRI